jgi:hypothetical protein
VDGELLALDVPPQPIVEIRTANNTTVNKKTNADERNEDKRNDDERNDDERNEDKRNDDLRRGYRTSYSYDRFSRAK